MTGAWYGLALALILIAAALIPLPNEGAFRGFPIPVWGLAIELCVGLLIGFISIRSLLRDGIKHKEAAVTEEEIAEARATLERMYVKEHGTLPDYTAKQENGATAGDPAFGPASDSAFDSASGPAFGAALPFEDEGSGERKEA